jgi:KUP system potassium uptake protein
MTNSKAIHSHTNIHQHISLAGILVTLGIVFGDIGTSPLYVFKAIIGENKVIRAEIVLGGISCIFWTLLFQTTIKYVFLTLKADNNGEGGIFSLYALIRKRKKWLIIPAIIGGSFLLADGVITPPISVSSAVEGLKLISPHINTVPIVILILVGLFCIQQFGTQSVGVFFGPIMLTWFLVMGIIGLSWLATDAAVLKAINPLYAYHLLVIEPGGFWLLGAVFLCTTGAEALYSDMGHCGRNNIRVSWAFVKICLLLNYFGQGAWLISHSGKTLTTNPFYALYPEYLLIPAIILATLATIIASQALISGSYTLVSEAMRLELWPKAKIVYPTVLKGQIYIPSVNWSLLLGCIGIVIYFRESSEMEAAYGLAITMTMITTSILLSVWLAATGVSKIIIVLLLTVFLSIESVFLIANIIKIEEGGWVSLLIGALIGFMMWFWCKGRELKNEYTEQVSLLDYVPILKELSCDLSVPKFSTNLIYLSASGDPNQIDKRTIYSILNRQPKRADIYYFLHIEVVDEPYHASYKVDFIEPDDVIWITFKLGFRIEPRINLLFRKVIEQLVLNKEIDITSRYESLGRHGVIGDFHFVVLESFLSYENELPLFKKLILDIYFLLKKLSISDQSAYGLDTSSLTVEKVPLIVSPPKIFELQREYNTEVKEKQAV